MSDKGLRIFEVQLSSGEGVRIVHGDEWTSDGGHLSIWHDDRLVAEIPDGRWIYILDETSRVESGMSLSLPGKRKPSDA